jgi:hypothetical protein
MYDVAMATPPNRTTSWQFAGQRVTSSVQHSRDALKAALRCAAAQAEAGDSRGSRKGCVNSLGASCIGASLGVRCLHGRCLHERSALRERE